MSVPTKQQVSAGGVVFRRRGAKAYVALISVGDEERWIEINRAEEMLAFQSEKKIVARARQMIEGL